MTESWVSEAFLIVFIPPSLRQQLGVSLDEMVTERDLDDLLWVFGCESSAVRWRFSLMIYILSVVI